MKYWKISNQNGVVGFGSGDTFPYYFPRLDSDTTYTIEVRDSEGKSGSTTYETSPCPRDCNSEYGFNNKNYTIPYASTEPFTAATFYSTAPSLSLSGEASSDWIGLVSANSGKVVLSANTQPSTQSRSGYATLYNGECVFVTTFIQNGEGCDDCSTFAITNPSSQSLSFGSGATSSTVTWSGGNCVGITSIVPSDSWITSAATSSYNQFKINVTENKNIARNGSVVVYFSGGNCASSATVAVHQAEGCNCNSIEIDTLALQNFDKDAYGSSYAQELTVTSGECISDIKIDFDNGGHFTGETRNGKIAVWPTSKNTDISAHTSTCTVTYGVNGSPCSESSKTINLTQNGIAAVTNLTINGCHSGNYDFPLSGGAITLSATVEPSYAPSGVTWATSSAEVATVNDGVVTPIKVGLVTISATTDGVDSNNNHITRACTMYVTTCYDISGDSQTNIDASGGTINFGTTLKDCRE